MAAFQYRRSLHGILRYRERDDDLPEMIFTLQVTPASPSAESLLFVENATVG